MACLSKPLEVDGLLRYTRDWYDVFLSCRGEDTSASFTSHLHAVLQNTGIFVCKDDDPLRRGDQISTSLLRGIQESPISIIVFSTDYADSSRCMGELVQIMKCHRTIGQVVLPVFYDVDPSEVCHQRGKFGIAYENMLNRLSTEIEWMQFQFQSYRWRKLLHEAGSLAAAGFVVSNYRNENEAIKDIVENVTHLLDKINLCIADNPVGVETRVQDIIQLLETPQSNGVILLGMWGVGGIGKSTIAKAIYNEIGPEFDGRSFLANVREVWEQSARQVDLQEQLLNDIFKEATNKIHNIELGKSILMERLCHKKVLVILDDVSTLDQLNALCGSHKWFGSGSRIIITTRDKHILRENRVDQVYTMKEMDGSESIELFSWHAFKQASAKEDFAEITRNVVEYCGGLPLALEVLGSYLFDRQVEEWNCVLEKLKLIPNDEVDKKLKISYDGLNDDTERVIFLDIACLFIGHDLNEVVRILNGGGLYAEIGISVLVERSLVFVDLNNRLGMHDLLRDMGRKISREVSPKEPGDVLDRRLYDVFLSFRGEDTRASFTSHLYAALANSGIFIFKDENSLRRGDQLSTSLLRGIEESRISIIVFSTNYADSSWCLEELAKIMKCHRTTRQVVLPVFYDVDPSEVRHQRGRFGIAFENMLNRLSNELEGMQLQFRNYRWRAALHEAASLAGFVVFNSRNESEAIKDIVKNVTHLLDKTNLFIADNPVGVETRVQDIIQLLETPQSNGVVLLGMWGMGGIGKSSIAKAVYNKFGRKFEGRSYLANIREVWEQGARRVDLQEQLLNDIFKETPIKIHNIESGKSILMERLPHKKVLLVLDDVSKLDQLNALCGSHKWFGSGSRIIITTRDKHILRGNRVDQVYTMKEMDGSESIELFSWHAFKQASAKEDFAEITRNVVEYCGGLPLALEVLGSYLFDRQVKEWNCVLEKLKIIPNDEVHKKLKISYDGLNDDTEKEIFLDIACFFIGKDRNDVIHILNGCGLHAEIGISVLVERSLVTVDLKNRLGMHDLLRDMGREIIREISPKMPEERSRLWYHKDVLDVLSEQTGTKAVEGLALKLPGPTAEWFSAKAFENMKKLRLLQLAGVQLDGDFKYLSRSLRWLCWKGFPLTYIPTSFYQGNLVSIELETSNVKLVWKEMQRMEKLKILNLSHSHYLTQTPDFSNLPNLEKLVLKDCPRLSEVSHSIGDLEKVLLINLKDCISLGNLPRSIYRLKSLKTLILSGCLRIDKLEEDLEQMESLTTLIADNTAITKVPFSVVRSKSIGYISLCGYEGFSRDVFPSIILSWMSPASNLSSFGQTSAGMSSLVSLDVSNTSSHDLSSISKGLPMLQSLWVECGSELQLSRDTSIILDALNATSSKELESTATTSQESDMKTPAIIECHSQVHISGTKSSLKSLLIQMGMNCQVTNILKESILQNMTVNGDCLLPGDNYPDWLTFHSEGSSVIFEAPQVERRNLKAMMCIIYYITPDNITSDGLKNVLLINHTKTTIQLYKRGALASFENEEWQRVVSTIDPSNKVEVVVVFENGFSVKKTAVYLIYEEKLE